MNLGKCIVCSTHVDVRFKHQCQKSFKCNFCNDIRWFRSSGKWDEIFYWTCGSCSGVHIPLHVSWQRLFGFPSWIEKKDWGKWNALISDKMNNQD